MQKNTNKIDIAPLELLDSLKKGIRETGFWIMLFLGFSAGLPLLLIFGTLSVWLNEAGVQKSTITFFSWAALGYSFKFIWAPIIDQVRLPLLSNWLGRRRAWLLTSQILIVFSILGMALIDPTSGQNSLIYIAIFAVCLGFSSATQDIVIDAYRIELATEKLQALFASSYTAGYRIAMIASGGVALYLSEVFGSSKGNYDYIAWEKTYIIMAAFMGVGILTTLLSREPKSNSEMLDSKGSKQLMLFFLIVVVPFVLLFYISSPVIDYLKIQLTSIVGNKNLASLLLSLPRIVIIAISCFFIAKLAINFKITPVDVAAKSYWHPVKEFIQRYKTSTVILILLLIGFYRVSDIVLGIIANVFYQDTGFSKTNIFTVVKTFGVVMTLLGSFIGGILAIRIGVMKVLLLGAILSALTNLLFVLLSQSGNNIYMLYVVISVDNMSAGIASIAFVAFLSKLTNVEFTATQYAIFTSFMLLMPKVIGGYSGTMVDSFGYSQFFIFTTLLGLPVIFLVYLVGRKLEFKNE